MPIQSRDKLDAADRFDAVALPFELEVEAIYTEEQNIAIQQLAVTYQGTESVSEMAEGDEVRLGLETFKLKEIRRWSGLYPHPSGVEMAQLAIDTGGEKWIENIFLTSEGWSFFEPNGAARLVWCRSAEDAGRRSVEPLTREIGARWSVRDGDVTHRFDEIVPGTGIETSDGTEYTLIDYREATEEETAAIAISVKKDGDESVSVVEANIHSENERLQFDLPSARTYGFLVYVWLEQSGTSCIVRDLKTGTTTSGMQGDSIPVASQDYNVRVDSALPSAVPVLHDESTVSEAVLTSGRKTLRLRHGQPYIYRDYAIEFRRTIVKPETDLLLIAHHRDAASVTTFRLPFDSTMNIMGWILTLLPSPTPDIDVFLIRAQYQPGLPLLAWIGSGLVLISGVVLAVIAFLVQRLNEATPRGDTL